VIAKTERYIAGSVTTEGTGRAVRDAHAKGYGLVRAEVEILARLPAEYAQGIYAKPSTSFPKFRTYRQAGSRFCSAIDG